MVFSVTEEFTRPSTVNPYKTDPTQPLSLPVTPRNGYMKKTNRMVDINNDLIIKFILGLFSKYINYKGTSLTYLVKY